MRKTMGASVLARFAFPFHLHSLFCLIDQLGLSKGRGIVPRSLRDGRDDKIQLAGRVLELRPRSHVLLRLPSECT
ncbi:hypothetical protein lerEdw1_016533, partial [Lerista edwardsae]